VHSFGGRKEVYVLQIASCGGRTRKIEKFEIYGDIIKNLGGGAL
jgi:hypothetical protein